MIENELDKLEAEMKEWKQQDEDVLSYALFPQVATDFFKYRQAQQEKVDMTQADTKTGLIRFNQDLIRSWPLGRLLLKSGIPGNKQSSRFIARGNKEDTQDGKRYGEGKRDRYYFKDR